nr:MAG TPA_asm: hypothetical protein [Caudoviricetes sp.]
MPKSVSTGLSLLNGTRRAVVFGKCVLTENPFRADDLNGIYVNASHVSGLKHHDRSRVRLLSCRKAVDKRRGRMGPGLNRKVNEQRSRTLARHLAHVTWSQLVIHNQFLRLFCLIKAAGRSVNVQAPDTTACRCQPRWIHVRTGFRLGNLSDSRAIQPDRLFEPAQCRQGIPISRHSHRSVRLPSRHSSRTSLGAKIESSMTASISVIKEPE